MNGPRADELPESLAEIVRAIGLAATLRLVERWGGVRVYLPQPQHVAADHVLARALGCEPARTLAALYPGETLPVPKAERALRAARDRQIRDEASEASAATLALRHGLTERQVYRILAEGETPEPQQPLF